ncbi:hypothetical protein NE237_001217 [Protea cynaroides]|uniref:Uncharacterized protein n=1 Tax=Protea cynaroides TaxID=273540 RepID=A0A9Q0KTK0_9MAGN|nr:hypothetical protein NE237_001217 [Protea cynaroides]
MGSRYSAHASTTLDPSLPSSDDIEMQAASLDHYPSTNLNPNNFDSVFSSETNNIKLTRMDIGIWSSAATPLSVLYYQEHPHVPLMLRFILFVFMLASMVYLVGIFLLQKFPSLAQLMIQMGVALAAISFFLSMGLMLL